MLPELKPASGSAKGTLLSIIHKFLPITDIDAFVNGILSKTFAFRLYVKLASRTVMVRLASGTVVVRRASLTLHSVVVRQASLASHSVVVRLALCTVVDRLVSRTMVVNLAACTAVARLA